MAATDSSTIVAAIKALETTYMSHGIAINRSKCEWIAHQTCPPPLYFRSIPHNTFFNTTLVSIPLGNDDYRDNIMVQNVAKWDEQFDNVKNLRHAQTMLLLLRNSLQLSKVNYSIRANFAGFNSTWISRFDARIKDTLESILAHPITDTQWLHSQLPINKGGLGIRTAEPFTGAAYFASAMFANRKLPVIHKDITNILWIPPLEFDKAVAHYNSNSYSASNSVNIIDIHTTPSQAKLSQNINQYIRGTFKEKAENRMKKLLAATSSRHSSDYLKTLPNIFTKSHFGNNEFRSILKYRIGQDETTDSKCHGGNACQDTMDQHGDHALDA
ncbi:hypothetical protein RFI_25033 [Reticulomyxa filosa]|uniref:Reverse transcriptase domain-containing protein n=1 Tax=Reticulomyxa filosa TaxID=46433 RepID=X6MEM6_RETFI|nr:hypothetical protein RFI_25033 [Reticulomyxa filosa]|eukprot:ETO12344.1 hypothetical protein RFI_25033 [Reticulomyxa filosa]